MFSYPRLPQPVVGQQAAPAVVRSLTQNFIHSKGVCILWWCCLHQPGYTILARPGVVGCPTWPGAGKGQTVSHLLPCPALGCCPAPADQPGVSQDCGAGQVCPAPLSTCLLSSPRPAGCAPDSRADHGMSLTLANVARKLLKHRLHP